MDVRIATAPENTPQGDVHSNLRCNGSPEAKTLMDLWSSAETLMFMSLSMVLNRTVAPASRHTRAKLRSVGQALVRSLPDLPQAALCLPSVSKGVPHSH